MSLTYTQKQYIQKHYPEKSVEEISADLGISLHKVEKHIDKHSHIFEHKKKQAVEKLDDSPKTFKEWMKRHWMNLLILVGLVIIVYINAFTSEFVSDDIQGIQELENLIKTPAYIFHNPLFFLRSLEIYIAYQIGGMNPFWYRLYSIFTHIGVVTMIYSIVPFFSKKQYLPFFVAALAAVHPMMIESVTWISGGIYSHAAFFVLLAFLLYLHNNKKANKLYLAISYISFLVGLTFSEKLVVFPLILLVYEFSFNNFSKTWIRVLPYFGITGLKVLSMIPAIGPRMQYLQTTNGSGDQVYIYNPFTQVPIALGTYLKLFIWPRHLTLYHSDFYRNAFELITIFVLSISFIGVWIYTFFKKNKLFFFWMSYFVIGLLVTLNPFGLSWVVAERYIYFSSFAVYFLTGYFIHKLIDSEKYKTLGYLLFVLLLIGFSIRTLVRNHDWRNVDNLWIATGKASPSDPKTHNNLGDMHARHGNMEMAIKEFTIATELNPGYSAAYYNIGNTYKHMKNDEKALEYFLKALERNPTIWQAYMNIAIIYFDRGMYDEAEKYITEGLKYDSKNAGMYANLGVIQYTKGNKEQALVNLQKALEIDPQNQFALGWMQKVTAGQ